MNSNSKFLIFALIGLVISNLVLLFFIVKGKPYHRKHRGAEPREIIIDQLNFDESQIMKYDQLIDKHQSVIRPLHDSLMTMKKSLYSLLNTNSTDSAEYVVNQMAIFHQKIEMAHYHHFIDVKSLCRPDQSEKFKKLTSELANFFSPPHQRSHHKKRNN